MHLMHILITALVPNPPASKLEANLTDTLTFLDHFLLNFTLHGATTGIDHWIECNFFLTFHTNWIVVGGVTNGT